MTNLMVSFEVVTLKASCKLHFLRHFLDFKPSFWLLLVTLIPLPLWAHSFFLSVVIHLVGVRDFLRNFTKVALLFNHNLE